VEHRQAQGNDEVIDKNLLIGLAILAQGNNHSVVEEINIALSAYITEHLPQELDENSAAPVCAGSYTEN